MGRTLKIPSPLTITESQKIELNRIATARTTPLQISKRANILRLTAKGVPYSVTAVKLEISLNTVKLWRKRWDEFLSEINEAQDQIGIEAALLSFLQDKIRSGQPRKFSDIQVKQIVSLACDRPTNHGLIMNEWTYETLAAVAQEKNIVPSISKSHVRLLLKNAEVTTA